MEAGIGYINCNATCEVCTHKWVAVIEVDTLTVLFETEYKAPENIECPNCGNFTSAFEIVI
jgi:hypothetical protein